MTAAVLSGGNSMGSNSNGVNPIVLGSQTAETPEHRKLRKAAQEFEGLLISELWRQTASDISSLPGGTSSAEGETMNSLAIQTMSMALAQHGGLGIAQMLIHQLEPSLHRGQTGAGEGKIKAASSA